MSELLARFAAIRRDDSARPLIHRPGHNDTLSAAGIWEAHLAIAETLTRHGVSAGHLVVSAVGNTAASVPLLLACRAIGAAMMAVDAGATHVEVTGLAERFGAAAIVGPSPHGDADIRRVAADTRTYPGAAMLKLTSGSTGQPKAAITTEAQLVADALHIIEAMGIRPDDTQIAAIPVSHSYGLGNLMLPLLLQGTAFVLRDSFVPQQLPDDARRAGARVFPGVPFMFDYFLANPPAGGWPRTLRLLISAGAPLAPATARAFFERFGVKIHSFYGATETGGIAYDDGDDAASEGNAIGRVMPGVTVTLRDDDRIHVVSDAVASGYCGGDGGVFVDGGFLTGDCGAFDACGRLALVGRVSSFVNVAGRKVQPEEVERVLHAMPGVVAVRVVSADDPRRGQQLVACIVAAPPSRITSLAVRQFCASRLAPHKIPRLVFFLDAIPLTVRGKTDRAALDALVRARMAQSLVVNFRPQ
jgi:acyl-CoA synthetase (AMP-forming)/AMP-acid ligase II